MSTSHPDPASSSPASGTLQLKDIAALAGVSRAAVSNWRRRYEDFPQPAEGSTDRKPIFDYAQITEWLRSRDLLNAAPEEADLDFRFRSIVREFSRGAEPLSAVQVILTVLALKKWSTHRQPDSNAEGVDAEGVDAEGVVNWAEFSADPNYSTAHAAISSPAFPGASGVGGAETPDAVPEVAPFRFPRNGELSERFPVLVGAIDLLGSDDYAKLCDITLTTLLSIGGRGEASWYGYPGASAPKLLSAALTTHLAQICDEETTTVVYDPAAGIGGVFAELCASPAFHDRMRTTGASHARDRHAADVHEAVTHVGLDFRATEINPDVALVLRLRSFLEDLDIHVTQQDSLEAETFEEFATLIATEPPFGMRIEPELAAHISTQLGFNAPLPASSEWAFIASCFMNLLPGGYAYLILMPSAGTHRAGRSIRENLVARGALEAVIQLPKGTFSYTTVAPQIWVLRKPTADDNPSADVTLINATGVDAPEQHLAHWLLALRAGEQLPIPHRTLGLAEFITTGSELNPVADCEQSIDLDALSYTYRHAMDRLSADGDTLAESARALNRTLPQPQSKVSLQDLLDRGAVVQLRGHQGMTRTDDVAAAVATAYSATPDTPVRLLAPRTGDDAPGKQGDRPRPFREPDALRAGDIVVFPTRAVLVDEVGLERSRHGELPVYATHLSYRVLDDSIAPSVVAQAITSTAATLAEAGPGSAISPRPRNVHIPIYAPADTADVVEFLHQWMHLQRAHNDAGKALRDAESALRAITQAR